MSCLTDSQLGTSLTGPLAAEITGRSIDTRKCLLNTRTGNHWVFRSTGRWGNAYEQRICILNVAPPKQVVCIARYICHKLVETPEPTESQA